MLIDNIFQYKKANPQKLISFGFNKNGTAYTYASPIMNAQFVLHISVIESAVTTQLIDVATNEEYVLHRIDSVSGGFIGLVRTEYERILTDIAEQCFETDIFKSNYAKNVIAYVQEKYGDNLEFLWERFPTNAIWRRQDTNKWYAAILVLSKRKLGIDSDELIDVLNLHMNPDELKNAIDNQKYFAGYHMNKKHWCSICLDGSLSLEEIFKRIDDSYALALK